MWKAVTTVLIGSVLTLVTLGIVMLTSTSQLLGQARHGDPSYFLKRQVIWLALAAIGAFIASRINYHTWRKLAPWLGGLVVLLLALVLVPEIGHEIKGSRRWLKFGPMTFQPSELGKIVLVFMIAWWTARIRDHIREFGKGLVAPLALIGIIAGLIFIEPDFSTAMLVGCIGMVMLFIAGTRLEYLTVTGALGLSGFSIAVMEDAERMRRIIAFIDPYRYADNEGFQLVNGLHAFFLGGGTGVGLGESMQKRYYLPEAHTDFILPIIGEELGLIATLGVLILFALIFFSGLWIAFNAQDLFGRILGAGIATAMGLQAMMNIGVVTGALPTTGLALPFISSGGSNLVISGAMIGILINIARFGRNRPPILDQGLWT